MQYRYQLWLAQWFRHGNLSYGYKQAKRITNTRWVNVILDNGAFEGTLVPTDQLVDMICDLKPGVAVLPDLPGEYWMASWEVSMKALKQLEQRRYKGKVMICPQGRSKEEVCMFIDHCIRALDPKKTILGLGLCYKHWTEDKTDEGARVRMLNDIPPVICHNWRIHMLGGRLRYGSGTCQDLTNFIAVTGLDSFKPTQAAYGLQYLCAADARMEQSNVQGSKLLGCVWEYAAQYYINIFSGTQKASWRDS